MKFFDVSGALAKVVSRNSGSVVQPVPSSREPELFSMWSSFVLIFSSFEANLSRRDLESFLICSFSSGDTCRQSAEFAMVIENEKCL